MGNTTHDQPILQKGEGYRVITIQQGSPFQGKVEEFFDFVIDVIAPPPPRDAQQILDKLDPNSQPRPRSLMQVLRDSADQKVEVKVVSTKWRKVRTVEVVPSAKWSDSGDLTGVNFRRERYDDAFDTYFPITDIQENSPIKKAGVREGQYLIGCQEFSYPSLDAFTEGLYEIYFDKSIESKAIHMALYDIASDILFTKEVTLKRGWGGKGLLGCEFLQGLLNKFPSNLEEQRRTLRVQEGKREEVERLRNELGECDGASKTFYDALQLRKSKKGRHINHLKKLLDVQPVRPVA